MGKKLKLIYFERYLQNTDDQIPYVINCCNLKEVQYMKIVLSKHIEKTSSTLRHCAFNLVLNCTIN